LTALSKEEDSIDPFGTSSVNDYERLYREFGIEPFSSLLSKISDPPSCMRRGIVFGHRDFRRILDAIRSHESFAVLSGIKPTGELHLGTLMTAKEIIYFQKHGGQTFYCIADIEAYEDNKIPFDRSQKTAVDNIADVFALGLDPEKTYVYRQSKENRVKDMAIIFARPVTLATVKAVYGERRIGLYLSALIQAGDILLPQLEEFGGPKPTVVPVGVDQDPHLRFTRDLCQVFKRKYGFVPPSSIYHKLIGGLDGSPKMAKRLGNYFTLHDKEETVVEKVSKAFTGGRNTIKEQHKLGGVPEKCPVYDICLFHFVENDDAIKKTYDACKDGELMCGEHKEQVIDCVLKFMKEHRRRKRRFLDKAEAAVLTQ
jgi:tryptophanyl-tRNA synthetase